MIERSEDIKLLINYSGSPECDPAVCCISEGRHVCYREPGHFGVHCCGMAHYGELLECRKIWPNAKHPSYEKIVIEEVDFEREI